MAHTYLGDGYGKYGDRDPDGGRDESRGQEWRGERRDQNNDDRGQRDRNFMFDDRESRGEREQHEHYLRWRQQQIDALDRDYRDYCRERQQQFHQDFSSWRSSRQPGQRAGGATGNQSGELELSAEHSMDGTAGTNTDPKSEPQSTIDPDSAATLGTNNSENSATRRRR